MIFDPFGDYEQAGYLRNYFQIKDRNDLAQVEFNNYRTVLADALEYLEGCDLHYADILQVHRILFTAIYPWAGQDRFVTAPSIAVGRGGLYDLFCHPNDCRRAAEHALRKLNSPREYIQNPGDAYSQLCYAHPFLDGNGRTLLLVHSEMLRRASVHIVWEDVDPFEFLAKLTDDLQSPDNNHLNNFLRPFLAQGERNLNDLQTVLLDQIRIHGR